MKTTNYIIWALVILISIFSCSKKDDFRDNNNHPEIELSLPGETTRNTFLDDTVKMNWEYTFYLFIEDEETNLSPIFIYDGDTIPERLSNPDFPWHYGKSPINDTIYTFICSKPGSHRIVATVKDSYGKSHEAEINLYVIPNLTPEVSFEVTNTGVLDPLEITIDASKTKDADCRWGGTIETFEYTINNNQPIQTALNKINYIVEKSGNYTVHVRARDNDGEWSEAETKYVTVRE